MKRYVLDSYALISYLTGEEGAKPVVDIFKKTLAGEVESFLCVVNLSEMYYILQREGGLERAEFGRKTIGEYAVQLVDANEELAVIAAHFKAGHKMSLADAFAAALAKHKKAELVTGDREFKPLEKEIKILWI